MGQDTTLGGDKSYFPDTIWGAILGAKDCASPDYRENLQYLISTYWRPVYVSIRIGWKKSNEEAKDLTQGFFTDFLEKDYLTNVSPDKGRFRTFVRTALKYYLIKDREKNLAQKRGGSLYKINFEELNPEAIESFRVSDPQEIFDIQWANTVIANSIVRLKELLISEGKEVYFEVFDMYNSSLPGSDVTYESVAEKLNLKKSDVRNYLSYTKTTLKKCIKDEIKKYLADPADVEEELKYLLEIKAR